MNALASAAAAAVVVALVLAELRGRRRLALAGVAVLLLVDALLFPEVGQTGGLLRVPLPAGSAALAAVATLAVVGARAAASALRPAPASTAPVLPGRSRDALPVQVALTCWLALLAWLAAAALRGWTAGHPAGGVAYQAMGVAEVAGAAALAFGARPWHGRRSPLWTVLAALGTATAVAVLVAAGTGRSARWHDSLLPSTGLGTVGGDAASLLGALGVAALAVALLGTARRPLAWWGVAVVLSAAPFAASQRAGVLGWAAGTVVVLVLAALRRDGAARRRLAGLGLAAVVLGCLAIGVQLSSSAGTSAGAGIAQRYDGIAKQQSAQSRLNQWDAAGRLVREHPWTGSGLATPYEHFEVGSDRLVRGDITHDVALDLTVRSGLVGLALFTVAALATLVAGAQCALRATPAVAAGATGAVGGLVALLAKGSVESILEKPRLAVALGLALGLVLAAARSRAQVPEQRRPAGDAPSTAAASAVPT